MFGSNASPTQQRASPIIFTLPNPLLFCDCCRYTIDVCHGECQRFRQGAPTRRKHSCVRDIRSKFLSAEPIKAEKILSAICNPLDTDSTASPFWAVAPVKDRRSGLRKMFPLIKLLVELINQSIMVVVTLFFLLDIHWLPTAS